MLKLKPGAQFQTDLSGQDYRATGALSNSGLSTFRRSPLEYYRVKEGIALPRAETADMRLGHAIEHAAFWPETFGDYWAILPLGMRRGTKLYKEWAAENGPGKMELSQAEAYTVEQCRTSLEMKTGACGLIRGVAGWAQPSLFTGDARAPHAQLKCRPDYLNPEGCKLIGEPYIVDCKSVASLNSADFHSFDRAVANFGYHRQAAFYQAVTAETVADLRVERFVFLVLEKQEPFDVAVFELKPRALDEGWREVKESLAYFDLCNERNQWPGWPDTIEEIDLPAWYYTRAQAI